MLMNKLEVWSLSLPFIREWVLTGVTKKYYASFFNRVKGGIVLEIGCGNGAGAKTIKKYFLPKRIIATDLDPRMISIAKRNIHDPAITLDVADAAKLPYKNASFDAVFDYLAIHHIPAPHWEKSLKELYRVLKPGGLVFIWDTTIETFNTLWGRVIKKITDHPYESMYTEEEFKSYFKKLGFKIFKEDKDTRHFAIVAEK